MSAFYIISYNIDDAEAFASYPPRAGAIISRYGGEVMVMDTEAVSIEGKGKMMNAIVRFPSQEAAHNCYNDPEYQAAKTIRTSVTSDITIVLAKGLE